MEQQENFCLARAHVNCPVYHQPESTPFPEGLMYAEPRQEQHRRPVWQFLIMAAGSLLIGLLLWTGYQSSSAGPVTNTNFPTPLPASTRVIPSQEPSKIPTFTQWPTNTPIPATPTMQATIPPTEFSSQSHALEIPIAVGEYSFMMHRVTEGEQILFLTGQYHTTLKALEWINLTPPAPLLTGKVIVIAPGLTEIDPSQPPLEPYQVMDKTTTIQGLAGKLGVDLEKLKYYNRCSDACQFAQGDWVLLPPRTTFSIPNTPTPKPSLTPSNQTHALEVPFTVGKWTLMLHRVTDVDQVIFLLEQYQTTIEVLQEINYKNAVPLQAGQVIVIAPGLIINVDPELPPFEPYQVTDKEISSGDLSSKLSIDLKSLEYYNNCSTGCKLIQGDWLIIPHSK